MAVDDDDDDEKPPASARSRPRPTRIKLRPSAHVKWHRLLPGDYAKRNQDQSDSYIPRTWYEHRLGLIDDQKKSLPCRPAFLAALQYYKEMLLAGNDRGYPPVRCLWRWFQPEGEHDNESGYWAPCRAERKTNTMVLVHRGGEKAEEPRYYYNCFVSDRMLIAYFWRARFHHLDPDPDKHSGEYGSLGMAMAYPGFFSLASLTPASRQLLLGSALKPRSPRRLRFPRADNWMWLATGTERLRHFVVDLDCKKEEDRPKFEAALRLFTGTPGLPPPGLVVTSRSTSGRHLYYFFRMMRKIDLVGNPVYAPLNQFAARFQEVVQERFGFNFAPGFVEVLPSVPSERAAMTYLPFGPGSYLCDARGAVVERDPIAALTRWHHRCIEAPIAPLSLDDLTSVRADAASPELLQALRVEARRRPMQIKNTERVPAQVQARGPEAPAVAAARSTAKGPKLAEVVALINEGPCRGSTFDDMPFVARYAKFHHGGRGLDEDVAEAWFRRWIAPIVNREHPMKFYVKQFMSLYVKANYKLSRGSQLGHGHLRLAASDCLTVAADIMRQPARSWPERKRLALFMLGCIGSARRLYPQVSGMVHDVPIDSRDMEKWVEDYAAVKEVLMDEGWGWLGLDKDHVPPARTALLLLIPGALAEYGLVLPKLAPGDTAKLVQGEPHALRDFLVRSLPATVGEAFAGKRNWRNLQNKITTH